MKLPDLKGLGFMGVVLALVAFFFRDQLGGLFNSVMEMLGISKPQGEAPAGQQQAAPASSSAAVKATTPAEVAVKGTDPQSIAMNTMAEWKGQMDRLNMPAELKAALLAKEADIVNRFQLAASTTQDPQLLQQKFNEIQLTAMEEAAKPQLNALMTRAKKQVSDDMDALISEVNRNQSVPQKEKAAALKVLREEKDARLKGLDSITREEKLALAMNPELQRKALEDLSKNIADRRTEVMKDISNIAREYSGWAYGKTALGWGSTILGVAGLTAGVVATFATGGLAAPLGVPLATISTGLLIGSGVTMAGCGVCRYAQHSGAGGSSMQQAFALGEIALGAIPLAAPVIGLGGKALAAGTVAAKEAGLLHTSAGTARALISPSVWKNATLVAGEAEAAVSVASASGVGAVKLANETVAREVLAEAIKKSAGTTAGQLMTGGKAGSTALVSSVETIALARGLDAPTMQLAKMAAGEFAANGSLSMGNAMIKNLSYVQAAGGIDTASEFVVPNKTPTEGVKPAASVPSKTLLAP